MMPPFFSEQMQGVMCVTVNKNVVCKEHRDKGNLGITAAMFLGSYEGGALLTESGDRFEERNVWHKYDGSKVLHWNEPILSGVKYSVILHCNANRPNRFANRKKNVSKNIQGSLERDGGVSL